MRLDQETGARPHSTLLHVRAHRAFAYWVQGNRHDLATVRGKVSHREYLGFGEALGHVLVSTSLWVCMPEVAP